MATQNRNARTAPLSPARRAYRALLRLLPFEFRAEFGRDMEDTFADEHDDVRTRRSVAETLRFWLRTASDFARTAPREHWDVLRQDVRFGARLLRRNRGFAATAILTLALGIAGSTGIFAVVYAVVLRPLAFPESERVVRIGWARAGDDPTAGLWPISYGDLQTLRETATTFDAIGGTATDFLSSTQRSLTVTLPGSGPAVGGIGQSFVVPAMASASLFRIFGASTVLGRLPDERDEQPGATPVVALSYSTWTSVYGRDSGVVGRTLIRRFGSGRQKAVTIVGVLAPGAFEYPHGLEVPAWGSFDPDVAGARDASGRELLNLSVYARLAPGESVDAARAQLAALSPQLEPGLPAHLSSANASLDAVLLRHQIIGRVQGPLLAFLGAVSCLLLLTSVNVASCVLARAMSRRQELAARFALGARPLRVARQLVTEGSLLAIAGGALGLGLAWAVRRAFVAISPSMPRLEESGINTSVLLFALAAVLLATCVAGLVPALQTSRRTVVEGLRRSGGASATATASSKSLSMLAAIEVALVLVLLAGTGLLVNSFARLTLFDLGFDPRSLVMFTIERTAAPASSTPVERTAGEDIVAVLSDRDRRLLALDNEVIQRVAAIPGVAATGLTGDDSFGPPYRYGRDIQIGDSRTRAEADLRIASSTAVATLGMRMATGRWFTSDDGEGAPLVAVVNETMARRFWGERSPVGDRIVFGHRTLRVVGVAADVYHGGARNAVSTTFYVPSTQMPPDPVMLVVRTHPEAERVDAAIAAELAKMGGRIAAGSPRRPEDIHWSRLSDARFLTLVLSVFSAIALAVALVGVYGVLRFWVAQRTREMGIRKALGATRFDIVAIVVGHALRFALPGCLAGLAAAMAAGPVLRSLLFGITPADPLSLLAATGLLIAAVVAGAYFPARRASAVDPALSLRVE